MSLSAAAAAAATATITTTTSSASTPPQTSQPSPTTIPRSLPSPLPSSLRDPIFSALLSTPNSIAAIQRTFSSALDASDWTQRLESRVLHLLRSGECTSYDALMQRVVLESGRGGGVSRVGGGTTDANSASLAIPQRAIEQGIKAVRVELDKAGVEVAEEDE